MEKLTMELGEGPKMIITRAFANKSRPANNDAPSDNLIRVALTTAYLPSGLKVEGPMLKRTSSFPSQSLGHLRLV